MKTTILLFTSLLFFNFQSQAQTDLPKGSVLLGGNLSFNSFRTSGENNFESKAKGFAISPSVGIAIRPNLFIGASAGYAFSSNRTSGDSTRINSYSYGLFARKYKPLRNNFYLFLQGNLSGSNSKRNRENNSLWDFEEKQYGVGLSLTPGVSYALNNKISLEAGFNDILGVGYSENKTRDNLNFSGERKQTSFNAFTNLNNFNSQIYVGFRLLFKKKDKPGTSQAG